MAKKRETEDKLQADCFQWFHNTYTHLRGLLYHVPNGEKRDPITANLLKAKGVAAGVPDLCFHYRGRTYFFELKKPTGGGVVSKAQKKIHEQLRLQGFVVYVINDFDWFKEIVSNLIENPPYQFTVGIPKDEFYYRHGIFDYLYSLSDCEVVLIEEITSEETRSKFINYVSEFMAEGFDKLAGFELLLTPDYKGFYKRNEGSTKEVKYNGGTT